MKDILKLFLGSCIAIALFAIGFFILTFVGHTGSEIAVMLSDQMVSWAKGW